MGKYKIDFHDEDEFLYAIKDSDEIEMDMRQRDNGSDGSNGDNENYKETPNKKNDNYDNNEDDNNDEEDDRNKTHRGNFEDLGSDYISLF